MDAGRDKTPALADAVERVMAERFSCRAFLAEPVPHETIARALAMAQRTATWCNVQPWQVFVVSGARLEDLRQALYRHVSAGMAPSRDFEHPRQYVGIYRERRRTAGYQLYGALGIAREDRAARDRQMLENFRFFGAPHLAVVAVTDDFGDYGPIDCGAWTANFLLAARACGIDTIAQAAIALHAGFIRARLGIAAELRIVCGVSFGYADRSHPANSFRTERADIGETVKWLD